MNRLEASNFNKKYLTFITSSSLLPIFSPNLNQRGVFREIFHEGIGALNVVKYFQNKADHSEHFLLHYQRKHSSKGPVNLVLG